MTYHSKTGKSCIPRALPLIATLSASLACTSDGPSHGFQPDTSAVIADAAASTPHDAAPPAPTPRDAGARADAAAHAAGGEAARASVADTPLGQACQLPAVGDLLDPAGRTLVLPCGKQLRAFSLDDPAAQHAVFGDLSALRPGYVVGSEQVLMVRNTALVAAPLAGGAEQVVEPNLAGVCAVSADRERFAFVRGSGPRTLLVRSLSDAQPMPIGATYDDTCTLSPDGNSVYFIPAGRSPERDVAPVTGGTPRLLGIPASNVGGWLCPGVDDITLSHAGTLALFHDARTRRLSVVSANGSDLARPATDVVSNLCQVLFAADDRAFLATASVGSPDLPSALFCSPTAPFACSALAQGGTFMALGFDAAAGVVGLHALPGGGAPDLLRVAPGVLDHVFDTVDTCQPTNAGLPPASVALSPDGTKLAFIDHDGALQVLALPSYAVLSAVEGVVPAGNGCAAIVTWSQGSEAVFASGCRGGTCAVQAVNPTAGTALRVAELSEPVRSLFPSPTGAYVVATSYAEDVVASQDGALLHVLAGPAGVVRWLDARRAAYADALVGSAYLLALP